jgi:beta-galactosidase
VDKQSVAIVQKWRIYSYRKKGGQGLPHIGTTWYRNKFTVPIDSKGKKIILFFEGAMSEPQVYLNGKKLENGHMVIVIFFLMFPNLYKKERTHYQ